MMPEQTSKVYAALAAFQAEIQNPPKDKKANIPTRSGAKIQFAYSDLATIWNTIRPVLAKHKLAVVQAGEKTEGSSIAIRTLVFHEDGGCIDGGVYEMPAGKDDPKSYGSAMTYCRRYSLAPVLGIVTDDDNDAPLENHARQSAVDLTPKAAGPGRDELEVLISECETLEDLEGIKPKLSAAKQYLSKADQADLGRAYSAREGRLK